MIMKAPAFLIIRFRLVMNGVLPIWDMSAVILPALKMRRQFQRKKKSFGIDKDDAMKTTTFRSGGFSMPKGGNMRPSERRKTVGVIIGTALKLALWGLVVAWLITHW